LVEKRDEKREERGLPFIVEKRRERRGAFSLGREER
jgi:hypothetical protein